LIQAVGAWGTVDIPEDYQQLDLQGKLVLPGLINAHCHLLGDGAPTRLLELSDAMVERILALFQTPLFKLLIRRRFRQHARTALHAGITTLRVLDDFTNFALALRDRIRQGAVVGPRLLCSGAPLYPTGGHGSLEYQVDSIPEIRRAVRQNVREEVDCIKILSTGGVSDARQIGEAGRPQMTVEEIACACREAHRGYVPVASHCESTRGIRENLLGGVDTIEHGAEIPEDLIACFKDNPKAMRGYTCLVPTISAAMGLATLPWEETRITRVKYENARIVLFGMIKGLQTAYESGIKFGVGNDASVPYVPHYDLWRELSYLVTYTGMSTKEAIYYATRNNAEVLGIEDVTGSVEVGLSADLIVLDADPFEDLARLKRPRHVFIRGKFIERPDYEEVKGLKPLAPISPELVGQADTTGPGCPTQGGVH
jgi:imidazolonepropionase-like amidohydrolase